MATYDNIMDEDFCDTTLNSQPPVRFIVHHKKKLQPLSHEIAQVTYEGKGINFLPQPLPNIEETPIDDGRGVVTADHCYTNHANQPDHKSAEVLGENKKKKIQDLSEGNDKLKKKYAHWILHAILFCIIVILITTLISVIAYMDHRYKYRCNEQEGNSVTESTTSLTDNVDTTSLMTTDVTTSRDETTPIVTTDPTTIVTTDPTTIDPTTIVTTDPTTTEPSTDCTTDIVLVLDRSGSMERELTTTRQFMATIPDHLPIGESNVLVSLVFVFNTYTIVWDFSSEKTSDENNLRNSINTFPIDEAIPGATDSPSLSDAFSIILNDVLPSGRANAKDVVVLFWDGDLSLSTDIAAFPVGTSFLSVFSYPTSNTYRINNGKSIVSEDGDFFHYPAESTSDFIDRLRELSEC